MSLHFEILDKKRKDILPLFKVFKPRFYLAGGTALALQLGHRDSIDFDFFSSSDFNPGDLLLEVQNVFKGHTIEVIQASHKTLNLIIDDKIKVSFFYLQERLLKKPLLDENLIIAHLNDIACMKITALLRAVLKDYVDLYYLFKGRELEQILNDCKLKYKNFDEMVYLKALVSFNDVEQSKILFVKDKKVTLEVIRKDFNQRVDAYLKKYSL